MQAIVKRMAIAMVVAVALAVTLGVIGAEEANASPNYGAGCAFVLENPTDHNCEVYSIMRHRYFEWSNDRYTIRYHWLKTHGYTWRASVMRRAAEYTCQGTLYEDFSCSGPKR